MDEVRTIFFDVFISFGESYFKTEAYVNIRPNSRLESNDVVQILKEGYKSVQIAIKTFKVTYGLISDKEIVENIKKYIAMPYSERIKNIYKFLVAKGEEPVNGKDSVLVTHIELKKHKTGKIDKATRKIDHRDLGFSERIVPANTKILTLFKATEGVEGIDVRGEVIKPEPGKNIHNIKFDKKTIDKAEFEDKFEFISKKEGFLYEDRIKGFFIDEKVLVSSVDFNIGNIEGKSVSDSSVIVSGKTGVFETAVKPGFKVEAKEVEIKGNVGNDAVVNGEFISIKGVADKNSQITGKTIEIEKSFNNTVIGEHISIKSCNNCKVVGGKVYLSKIISGEISGSEILVLNESRGALFKTDKFILLNYGKGLSKQTIIADPLFSQEKQEEMKKLINSKKILYKNMEELKNSISSIEASFKKLDLRINDIIEKYFNFKGENATKQKELIKNFIKKGEIEYLEEKFKPDFASFDVDTINRFKKLSNDMEQINNMFSEKEKELEQVEAIIGNLKSSGEKIKIVILNLEKGATIKIKNDLRSIDINHNLEFPLVVHFEYGGMPTVEALSRYKRESLKEKIVDSLSETSLKYLKKLRVI